MINLQWQTSCKGVTVDIQGKAPYGTVCRDGHESPVRCFSPQPVLWIRSEIIVPLRRRHLLETCQVLFR